MYIKVGFLSAPLQIEEVKCVIRIIFKGMPVPIIRIIFPGFPEIFIQILWILAAYRNQAGLKVDVHLYAVMDAAGVADQYAVDIDPDIIISGKLKLHGFQFV